MEKASIPEIIKGEICNFVDEADIKDFLTEDDLRCHLFSDLKIKLNEHHEASLHAEVRWYGSVNSRGLKQLKYRSDLVIIDRKSLINPVGEVFILPSKGYAFVDYFAIIEIKLRRPNNRETDGSYKKKLKKDISKLKEINRRTSKKKDPVFILISFDKKLNRKEAWLVGAGKRKHLLISQ